MAGVPIFHDSELRSRIVREARQGNAAWLFIGAGYSLPSGVPAGSELANSLLPARKKGEKDDRVQRVFRWIGESTFTDRRWFLRAAFPNPITTHDHHRRLGSLLRAGIFRTVITTNFDELVERGLEDAGLDPWAVRVVIPSFTRSVRGRLGIQNSTEVAAALSRGWPPIKVVKLFGDFRSDTFLFGDELNQPLVRRLTKWVLTRGPLCRGSGVFIGYSLSDPPIPQAIESLLRAKDDQWKDQHRGDSSHPDQGLIHIYHEDPVAVWKALLKGGVTTRLARRWLRFSGDTIRVGKVHHLDRIVTEALASVPAALETRGQVRIPPGPSPRWRAESDSWLPLRSYPPGSLDWLPPPSRSRFYTVVTGDGVPGHHLIVPFSIVELARPISSALVTKPGNLQESFEIELGETRSTRQVRNATKDEARPPTIELDGSGGLPRLPPATRVRRTGGWSQPQLAANREVRKDIKNGSKAITRVKTRDTETFLWDEHRVVLPPPSFNDRPLAGPGRRDETRTIIKGGRVSRHSEFLPLVKLSEALAVLHSPDKRLARDARKTLHSWFPAIAGPPERGTRPGLPRDPKSFFDWAFSHFGPAVGTSILVVSTHPRSFGCTMIAPRTGQVALHTNYFQFAGSGTINAMDDWHHGHIDTGLAALRESGYETSVRRRDLDFFSYLGYGYDATIGHPNLLFYGETPRDLSVRTDETETAEERFEVGQWKLISIRHPREIFSFLSHLETGEAPDLIDPEWGKSIGGFGLSPNNAVLLALSSRLFAAREKAGHIVAPTPT